MPFPRHLSLLALFLGATLPGAARAGDACASVDLRPALGPPRDQDDSGWCFAHTAADLLTQKTGVRVAAFDLAVRSIAALDHLEQSPSPRVRAYLAEQPELLPVLEAARRLDLTSLSPENMLSYRWGIFSHGAIEDLSLLVADEEDLCEDRNFVSGAAGFREHIAEIQRWVERAGRVSATTRRPDIAPASRVLLARVLDWNQQRCGHRRAWARDALPRSLYLARNLEDFTKRPAAERRAGQARLWEEINRALDERRVIAVGLDAYEIEEKLPTSLSDGDHSLVIAARRREGRECRYFVRDSVGATCEHFQPRFRPRCEAAQGGAWVRPGELGSLYSSVSYRGPSRVKNGGAPAAPNAAPGRVSRLGAPLR